MFYRIARIFFFTYAALALLYLVIGAVFLFSSPEMKPDPMTALPILYVGFPWSLLSLTVLTGKEASAVIFFMLGMVPLGLNASLLWLLQHMLKPESDLVSGA